jgi:hypothetical protein
MLPKISIRSDSQEVTDLSLQEVPTTSMSKDPQPKEKDTTIGLIVVTHLQPPMMLINEGEAGRTYFTLSPHRSQPESET